MSAADEWTEHQTPDGKRRYWHNRITNTSVWHKPEELKTDAERALDASPWKEFTAADGRKYWHNAQTKVSSWTVPAEYDALKAVVDKEQSERDEARRMSQQDAVRQQQQAEEALIQQQEAEAAAETAEQQEREREQTESQLLDFDTFAAIEYKNDNEKAFINMLRTSRIKADHKWDEAVRVLINNPLYRLLNTSAERKDAFEKYRSARRRYETELEKLLTAKRSKDFLELMQKAKVSPLTRYSLFERKYSTEAAWKAFPSDYARRQQFDLYLADLRREEREAARILRTANLAAFEALLKSIPEIDDGTTWAEAYDKFSTHPDFTGDLAKIDMIDCLTVFQQYVTDLDRAASDERRRQRDSRTQKERARRLAFKSLLADMKADGAITVYSKWKEVYPSFSADERYLAMLGQPGSTPLDLFRDLIVDLEEAVYRDGVVIKEVLKSLDFVVMPDTDFVEFAEKISTDDRMQKVDEANVQVVFDVLRDKAKRKMRDAMREEVRAQERRLRRHYSDFKYMLQRSDVVITPTTKWEDVRDNFYGRATLEAIGVNEAATLFGKYVRRLAEKESRHRGRRDDDGDGGEDRHNRASRRRESRDGGRDRKRRRHSRRRSRSRRSSVSTSSSRSSSRGRTRKSASVAELVSSKIERKSGRGGRPVGEASSDEEGMIAE